MVAGRGSNSLYGGVGRLRVRDILEDLASGRIDVEEAERLILEDLDPSRIPWGRVEEVDAIGRLDLDREARSGIPEVVFAQGKRPEDVARLLIRLSEEKGRAFATRAGIEVVREVEAKIPEGFDLTHHERARIIVLSKKGCRPKKIGRWIGLLAAGTSDVDVAEEARVTMEEMGCDVLTAYDVGVAGLHRLFRPIEEMRKLDVDAIVVVAGMEGALPTVVKALVDVPVIGVPTSVGYGYGGEGQAALMGMLQSCTPGLVVVNIDNGFGAGATAALIARRISRFLGSSQDGRRAQGP
jgi:NCAIR mutase (PurE)-related protein